MHRTNCARVTFRWRLIQMCCAPQQSQHHRNGCARTQLDLQLLSLDVLHTARQRTQPVPLDQGRGVWNAPGGNKNHPREYWNSACAHANGELPTTAGSVLVTGTHDCRWLQKTNTSPVLRSSIALVVPVASLGGGTGKLCSVPVCRGKEAGPRLAK